jgi:hypothetical protein
MSALKPRKSILAIPAALGSLASDKSVSHPKFLFIGLTVCIVPVASIPVLFALGDRLARRAAA